MIFFHKDDIIIKTDITKDEVKMAKPLVITHRGANKYAPQNTLPAFKKSAQTALKLMYISPRTVKLQSATTIQLTKPQRVTVTLRI